MYVVKQVRQLSRPEAQALDQFVRACPQAGPYHSLEFATVINQAFGYPDMSLATLNQTGQAVGYVPQWRKGRILESVPWRDKGGPLYENQEVLALMMAQTQEILRRQDLKGCVWRNCQVESQQARYPLVNVSVGIKGMTRDELLTAVNFKVRGKVRAALKNGLQARVAPHGDRQALAAFHDLLTQRRRQFGVPTYSLGFFECIFNNLGPDQARLLLVEKDGQPLAALLLLLHGQVAVDAYSASNAQAMRLKANDLMVFEALAHAAGQGAATFDFGGDSPLQESLTQYKMKWLGRRWEVPETVFGEAPVLDHNSDKYELARRVIRRMPLWLYKAFSRLVVR